VPGREGGALAHRGKISGSTCVRGVNGGNRQIGTEVNQRGRERRGSNSIEHLAAENKDVQGFPIPRDQNTWGRGN